MHCFSFIIAKCFNPCKGFRCFEAPEPKSLYDHLTLVSIPVRVLDVLKLAKLLEVMPDYEVSIPVRVLDVLKLRRFARYWRRYPVSIPVRVLDVLKLSCYVIRFNSSDVSIPVRVLDVLKPHLSTYQ